MFRLARPPIIRWMRQTTSGGPFTIGRVIHSSRAIGFSGWIGGVAVFNRALAQEELVKLARLRAQIITAEAALRAGAER